MAKSGQSKKSSKKVSKKTKMPKRVNTEKYDKTKPGDNIYDEARRATADLCRLTRIWVAIAESNEYELNPVQAIEFDDVNGEELPVHRPMVRLDLNLRRESLLKAVREHWGLWEAGVQRATDAIAHVLETELDTERVSANKAIMELKRVFFPHMVLHPSERPGDQLIRPEGPIYCRAGRRSNIHRYDFNTILKPLEDFSDLLAVYSERTNSSSEIPDQNREWIDRRPGSWFSEVTDEALYPALLRNARFRGGLTSAVQRGNVWYYPVDEVCFAYPQYAVKIRAAVADEM